MKRYVPKDIESKWQKKWEEDGIYHATEDPSKPKRYVLEYFPYPSGAAMHVGHVRNYTIGDVISRHMRMSGYNVLHPMGWDAFGLPAENYAIKNKISPRQTVDENTKKFRQQLMQMGFGYDWSREIDSTDPKYYKWTQWFFLMLFRRGLAYQKESLQWWCPFDKTVLANEQVENGRCWRCENLVEKKALKQWFFKITEYADRLEKDLDDVNWSDAIKAMQRNWIGRKQGIDITYQITNANSEASITTFTTHPDTNYGATFIVLAPEHPLVQEIIDEKIIPKNQIPQSKKVAEYKRKSLAKSDIERQEEGKKKTGVFTGLYALNTLTNEQMPVWVSDFVLMQFGTGAVVGVPAHDQRDYDFAKAFDIPIKQVIAPAFGNKLDNTTDADGVVVIGYDPKTQKFMSLVNKNNDQPWLVSGGRDEDESYEDAAVRELSEEAGYQYPKKLIRITDFFYTYYYNDNKKTNRRGQGYAYLAILDSTKNGKMNNELYEKFTVEWSDFESLRKSITDNKGGVEHWIFSLDNAQLAARDYDNGKEFIVPVYLGEGIMINSVKYDGLPSSEVREKIIEDLTTGGEIEEFFDKRYPFRKGAPVVERIASQILVQHPSENKYLLLKLNGWDSETYSLPMGGVKDDHDAIDGALRELREETGYIDHGEAKIVAPPYYASFYHEFKKENRRAKVHTVFTKLNSLERVEVSQKEKSLHEPSWVSLEVLLSKIHGQGSWQAVQTFREGKPVTSSVAREVINYKMRDWLISRQRYWGAPIPIIHCHKDGAVAVPDDQLPVELPELKSFEPSGDGRSPLANVPEFVNTKCPKCGGPAERETDTMDGFACSSWYFLRFADPHNDKEPFSKEKAEFWLPVDDYIGGAEHAVMHLLYARFWTKVMYDEGLISFQEPFTTLRNHGMILAPDGAKMSKSKGNTIEPDGLIEQGYGADSIRIMELFIGPWDHVANWSVEGIAGSHRFLQRIWALVQEHLDAGKVKTEFKATPETKELQYALHATTKRVSEDLHELGFNTAISAIMELVNTMYKLKVKMPLGNEYWQTALEVLTLLIAPFTPHISEELWQQLGQKESVHTSQWPAWNDSVLARETMVIVVQVNGKVRANIEVPVTASEEEILDAAKSHEKVTNYLTGHSVKKTIFVPKKLVNFVVS